MRRNKLQCVFFVVIVAGLLGARFPARAGLARPALVPLSDVTAYDLIAAMNTLRVSYGLPALLEDPIVNAVAQNTADIMAANLMSSHIGNVRGRLAAAGYGGGATVWATENFAVGNWGIDEIMVAWSDPVHMAPAVNPAYCHVGAGVAQASNGMTYYILQAAYISGQACGEYIPAPGVTPPSGGSPPSQIILPVNIATADADGNVYHIVKSGQTLWAIAIAYQITIRDLEIWNNISRDTPLQPGHRLFIPGKNTVGYSTPTPVGMVMTNTPDADGRIVHIVQPYQVLLTISEAYDVSVETILRLNGLQEDWPLQIGQKILIDPGNITPSPTPRPLTPIEKLTPESDGNYYHTVHSGETLSWIAALYDIPLADLMSWNGLTSGSTIWPDEKLLLRVTPPATPTFTPAPPTATSPATPSPTRSSPGPTASLVLDALPAQTTPESASVPSPNGWQFNWAIAAILLGLGVVVGVGLSRLRVSQARKPDTDHASGAVEESEASGPQQ